MIKNIISKPTEIKPEKRCYTGAAIYGLDFETVNGKPYTMQICAPGGVVSFWYLPAPEAALDLFLEYFQKIPEKRARIYLWHAAFDFPCLFFGDIEGFRGLEFSAHLSFQGHSGVVKLAVKKTYFGSVSIFGKTLNFVDGLQFFRCGLDRAARDILGESGKYPKPRGLGSRRLRGSAFERYAKRDADLTQRIGSVIEKKHEDEDIPSSISASQFAARIFRKYHLARPIPALPKTVERTGILSYHGGFNWVTPKAPGFFRGVTEYDINSAYPAAFCQLPDFSDPEGRWNTSAFSDQLLAAWGVGFVCVSWKTRCQFDALRGHDYTAGLPGVKRQWITTPEYRTALEAGCYDLTMHKAILWQGGGRSPFADYMEHFFREKKTAKNPVEKEFAKICLNGISGKMIQNTEHEDGLFYSGGLWNPAIASLVTGYTRAKMHEALHRYDGIHCATDSFFTTRADVPTGDRMGELSKKSTGDLLLLRNKLYVFFAPGSRDVIKWGAHGFWGSPEQLVEMWEKKKTRYKVSHLWKVREAFIQGKTPLCMDRVERELMIDWEGMNRGG